MNKLNKANSSRSPIRRFNKGSPSRSNASPSNSPHKTKASVYTNKYKQVENLQGIVPGRVIDELKKDVEEVIKDNT